MLRRTATIGLILTLVSFVPCEGLWAQTASGPLPRWRPDLATVDNLRHNESDSGPLVPIQDSSPTRSHTWTGLLVGGLVGGVATAVFLSAFCGDPDTQCGADEVGRAVLIIGVPPAVVGAIIGSLIRTKR